MTCGTMSRVGATIRRGLQSNANHGLHGCHGLRGFDPCNPCHRWFSSSKSKIAEMRRHMLQEKADMSAVVLSGHVLLLGRGHDVRMNSRKILEGIQFRDRPASGRKKYQFEWILPFGRQLPGQRITTLGLFLRVVDDYGGAHKTLIESGDHLVVGEQTCSQVRAAGSAALILRRSPRHDGKNGSARAARLCQCLIDRHPINVQRFVKDFREPGLTFRGG